MEPGERVELGKQLRDHSLRQGYEFPNDGEARFEDPDYLARLARRMRRYRPDLLQGLVGDGGAGLVGGMMGEGMTGGEGASGDGGMIGNPIAKAALAGIAAMAQKANGR